MITDQDTEIIEKEESTHLRLTPEFMKSIGVEVLDSWTSDLMVYVPKDVIRIPFFVNGEYIITLTYDEFIKKNNKSRVLGKVTWCDVSGYRIIGLLNHYSIWKEQYSVIVKQVDKL